MWAVIENILGKFPGITFFFCVEIVVFPSQEKPPFSFLPLFSFTIVAWFVNKPQYIDVRYNNVMAREKIIRSMTDLP
jgi:hypothetical protein